MASSISAEQIYTNTAFDFYSVISLMTSEANMESNTKMLPHPPNILRLASQREMWLSVNNGLFTERSIKHSTPFN